MDEPIFLFANIYDYEKCRTISWLASQLLACIRQITNACRNLSLPPPNQIANSTQKRKQNKNLRPAE